MNTITKKSLKLPKG